MSTLIIVTGVAYFVTLAFVVLPLCFGVIVNTWREALHHENED